LEGKGSLEAAGWVGGDIFAGGGNGKKLRIYTFILHFYACAEIAVNALQFTPLCESHTKRQTIQLSG
jgi:hypothetical protein